MKKINKSLLFIAGLCLVAVIYPTMAHAAGGLPEKILSVATTLKDIGIALVALMVVYAGILFLFAGGAPDTVSKAKSALLYAASNT